MNIGIDATNIKAGGGLVHLARLLENYDIEEHKIYIVGGEWINIIKKRKWFHFIIIENIFSNPIKQEFFKKFKLPSLLEENDIIFAPGGTFLSKKKPYISMSQNMLVFEKKERNRYPKSLNWLRYILLEYLQVRSFRKASGIIYISEYAKNYIQNKYPGLKKIKSKVIYHGISDEFKNHPQTQFSIDKYTKEKPYKLLYVSIINFYKHQWNVVEVVKRLRSENFNIELELVGPMYKPAQKKFKNSLVGTDTYIKYLGKIEYNQVPALYTNANLFIFASTCENMPNILLEAMSSGLPILSSDYGPMPEVLKDAGEYINPTDINSIYNGLKKLLLNPSRRQEIAQKAFIYSQKYSWQKTTEETFKFIEEIYNSNQIAQQAYQ